MTEAPFHQGYRACDLVRELSLLRSMLIDHISRSLRDKASGMSREEFVEALRVINLYIDEELSYASVYVETNEIREPDTSG